MELMITAYVLYFLIMGICIVFPGYRLYTHGITYLRNYFTQDKYLATSTNISLLTGYYILSFGYSLWNISGWPEILTYKDLIEVILIKSGWLMCGLGLLHSINMVLIIWLSKKFNNV